MFFPADCTWRKRVVVPVQLPPLGWGVYSLGWVEGARPIAAKPWKSTLRVEDDAIVLWCNVRLTAMTVEDGLGSWGDFGERPELCNLQAVRKRWRVTKAMQLEDGPERVAWWVRLAGGASRIDLMVRQYRGRDAVEFDARVIWNQSGERLKLVFSGFGRTARYEVPGGTIKRGECGEVPGGRWVAGRYGVATDALYNFNLHDGDLQATGCRGSKYAWGGGLDLDEPWRPTVDVGELKFRFLVTHDLAALPRLARELEMPPIVQSVPPRPGKLARSGSFGDTNLTLLSLQTDGRALIVRLQNDTGRRQAAGFRGIALGTLGAGEIGIWRINNRGAKRT
jgi:alpha-mannosidase